MKSRIISLIAILALLSAIPAWTQDARGTILGKVADPSGAVIPNAEVAVVNPAQGTRLTFTTNSDGLYLAPLLQPGTYDVEVKANGFKKAVRSSVALRIADRLDISFTLEVGAADQSVTITAEIPLLNAESASTGTVIDSQRVANLPLSYGNPFLLIGLTAGVTFAGSVRLDRPFEPTHIVNYSMGGTKGNLNDITIDGAPTTARANGNEVTASYVPPTDIVQEFKVQTATFDAQFGQTQGGVSNFSIKSGTNMWHGSAGYSFYRPSMLANDFFNNRAGNPVPDFQFNRWGGSFSGPVTLPKIYNGRNKTFFLFGYEGIKDSRPRHDDTTNTVPMAAMHTGDFSALLTGGGSSYAIYNPYTRVKLSNGRYQETAFPNNIIPSSLFNPVGVKILDYYPTTPKSAGTAVGVNNYVDPSTAEKADYWNWTTRIDQNIGDKQRIFGRASMYRRDSTYNDYFQNAMTGIQFLFDSKTGVFDHVITLTPTTVLNTRYSYNRFIRGSDGSVAGMGFDQTTLGFPSSLNALNPASVARFPRINLNGYISNGFTGELRPNVNHTISSTLTKALGKHSIRAGFEFRIYQQADRFFSNAQSGQYTFDSTWTKGPLDNSTASSGNIGQSVAALLLGLPGSGSYARSADYIEQSNSWGFFVQDDFKVSRKLTLNLGLRYEFETPLHERYNRSTLSFDPSVVQDFNAAAQAAYATIYPKITFPELPVSALTAKGGMTFAGLNGNNGNLYETPKNVFMPRVGLAYQVTPKTVIRAGFGLFAGFLGQRRGDVQQNGFSQNTSMVISKDNGLTWAAKLDNPFPNGITEPKGNADGVKTFLGQGFTFFNQKPDIPTTARWEFSLQREIKGVAIEANYIGSKSSHLEIFTIPSGSNTPTSGRNINALARQYYSTKKTQDKAWNDYMTLAVSNPLYGLVPGNTQGIYTGTTASRATLLSPYVAYGSSAIYTSDASGISWYHGLQLSANKRFAQGYTIMASYTYSKWMQAINLLNPSDPAPTREVADADAPHRITLSAIYELPFGKGKKFLANSNGFVSRLMGGWSASGIWSLQSGFPLSFPNSVYYGDPKDILLPIGERTVNRWFNTDGFEKASTNQLFTSQLRWFPYHFSQLRRQRMNNVDLGLIKDTRITEGKNFQFRAEALNAFNHPYFPAPNTTPGPTNTTTFGQISASTQDNYARRIQLSLRFIF